MHTTPLDHEIAIVTVKDEVMAEPIMAPPVKPSRSITIALTFLIGCVALLMTGFAIIMPVFPQRLHALGLGAETLALMEGAFGLGMFLLSTPMGIWAGRIGRKPILFISLSGFIVTNLLLAFVNVPLLFILIRFVEGMLISGLMPASLAMVGDSIPLEKQGRWIGFITTAQATGIALGPGIGGLLYQAWGFTSPFLLSAAIALVASLLAVFMVPETLSEQVRSENRWHKANGGTKRSMTKESSLTSLIWLFAPFLLIDFGLLFTYPFVFPQYPFFFEKVLRYSPAQYGTLLSTFTNGLGTSRTGKRLSRASPGRHLSGGHNRGQSRSGDGHARIGSLSCCDARPTCSGSRWTLDQPTDDFRYWHGPVFRHGCSGFSPDKTAWTGKQRVKPNTIPLTVG
jgi:MFS family permease